MAPIPAARAPRRLVRRHLLIAAALLGACSSGTTGPDGNGADFHASIDNQPWTSITLGTQAVINNNATFTIVGTNTNGSLSLSLVLYYITKPGTYPLGVGGTVPGGIATVSAGATSWSTPLSGAAGHVDITSVSTTHIVGDFSFTATPLFGSGTANRVVNAGHFDLPVTGTGSLTVPANLGSTFGGTLGGPPWNAATVVTVSHPSSGTMTVGASNTDYNVNVIISGFTGPAVYTLGTGVARQVTVTRVGLSQSWGGTNLSGGTVEVTSYTTARVKGTYNVLLQPGFGASGTLALAGNFDVGLP